MRRTARIYAYNDDKPESVNNERCQSASRIYKYNIIHTYTPCKCGRKENRSEIFFFHQGRTIGGGNSNNDNSKHPGRRTRLA